MQRDKRALASVGAFSEENPCPKAASLALQQLEWLTLRPGGTIHTCHTLQAAGYPDLGLALHTLLVEFVRELHACQGMLHDSAPNTDTAPCPAAGIVGAIENPPAPK